jgi:Protein of unknown function (DUF2785)
VNREFWRGVLEAEGALPDHLTDPPARPSVSEPTLESLTAELLGYLSSNDPELRDEFGFAILSHWIYVRQVYSPERLRVMMVGLISSLHVGLRVGPTGMDGVTDGEMSLNETGSETGSKTGTETVFGRSFAALILSVIADYDLEHPFLTTDELAVLLEEALAYFRLEHDWRGYVIGQGWAHSVAHTADLLANLARNPKVGADGLERILNAISAKLTTPDSPVLAHHEGSRLALVAHHVIARGVLPPRTFHAWLDGMPDTLNPRSQRDLERGDVAARANCEAFLSSLYLQLLKLKLPISSRVRSHVARVLEHFGFVI